MSLLPGPYEPVQAALAAAQASNDQVDDIGGGVFRLCGFLEFDGAGELLVSVVFPITFIDKPVFVFGGELRENSPFHNGRFPTISGIVKDWKFTTKVDTGQRQYTGCSFAIVATGHPDQQVIFHYMLEGPAFRNEQNMVDQHPLLGQTLSDSGVGASPHINAGSGIGIRYIGAADLIPASLQFTIDDVPVPTGSFFLFNEDTSEAAAPDAYTGALHAARLDIYDLATGSLSTGIHRARVSVQDTNGVTDNIIFEFHVTGAPGGPT